MMKITEDLGNLLGFFEEMRGLAEQQIKRLEKIKADADAYLEKQQQESEAGEQ